MCGVAVSRRQLQADPCADIDGSGLVGVEDLLLLLASYSTDAGGDTNGDGVTDVSDLLNLLSSYGSVSCAPGGGGEGLIVTLTTSHCTPFQMVVPEGMTEGRVGDCMVNVDQRMDPSSSLGGCGGHGADDGYCEVQAAADGYQVRACFHDRCWADGAQQCGDWGTSSSVDLWMDVDCQINDYAPPLDSQWADFQNFGPSGITQINGDDSLTSNGWTVDGINDWASCTGPTPGPICRWCPGGCSDKGIGEYAGFWAGGSATGIMDLPLPDGYSMAEVTLGMHYDNPQCQGIVSIGHVGVRPPPL